MFPAILSYQDGRFNFQHLCVHGTDFREVALGGRLAVMAMRTAGHRWTAACDCACFIKHSWKQLCILHIPNLNTFDGGCYIFDA